MKHILLTMALAVISHSIYAQLCTPDAQFANAGPGVYPETVATVDCSNILAAKTIVAISDTSLTSPVAITLYYDSSRVVSVSGLPAGLSFGTDVEGVSNAWAPYGAWVNGGTIPNVEPAVGCVYVTGSPTAWANAAAGGSGGVHTLTVEYDARISQANPALIASGTWLSQVSPTFGGGTIDLQVPLDCNPTNTLNATVSGPTSVDATTPYNYTTAGGTVSYNWVVTGGTIQSGQGTNSIMVVWDGGNPTGNVAVTVGDGDCEDTDDHEISSIVTGVTEVSQINAVVYPNPSHGVFNLRTDNTDVLNIRVMDVSGKVLRTEQLSGSNLYSLDMQSVPAGVYLLELESAEGRTFKRVIKH